MASKQLRRPDLTSDLKFVAQTITYAAIFALTVLASFRPKGRRKKESLPLLELSVLPQLKILLLNWWSTEAELWCQLFRWQRRFFAL